MNWDRIAGAWDQFTGKLKQKWAKLTDDDLKLVEGKKDTLVGMIQQRYGTAKDKVEQEVDSWLDSVDQDPKPAPRL